MGHITPTKEALGFYTPERILYEKNLSILPNKINQFKDLIWISDQMKALASTIDQLPLLT